MSDSPDEERIADLEIQVAHQARQLDDLNEIVERQWREIEKLTRSVSRLVERLQALEVSAESGPPGEEPPPPHY